MVNIVFHQLQLISFCQMGKCVINIHVKSEDPDQLAYLCSLIFTFSVHRLKFFFFFFLSFLSLIMYLLKRPGLTVSAPIFRSPDYSEIIQF